MKHYEVDYEKFLKLSKQLLEIIKNNHIEYQAILCPLKGGFLFSYFISKRLNLPIHFVEISSYHEKQQKNFTMGHIPKLKPGKYLICDDIYDSGKTIHKLLDTYKNIDFDIACLITKQKKAPIYSAQKVGKEIWVDFFWETM